MADEIQVRAPTDSAIDRFLGRIAAAGIAKDVEIDVSGLVVQLSVPFGQLDATLPRIREAAEDMDLSVVDEHQELGDRRIRHGRHSMEIAMESIPDSRRALHHLASELGGIVGSRIQHDWLHGISGVALPMQFDDEHQTEAERRRLLSGLASKRVTERRLVAFQAGGWPEDEEITHLLRNLAADDQDSYVRGYAAQSLGIVGDTRSSSTVRRVAADLAAQQVAGGASDAVPFLAAAVGCLLLGAHGPLLSDRNERFLLRLCRNMDRQVGDAVSLIAQRMRSAIAGARPN
jgi:hypothetical protein